MLENLGSVWESATLEEKNRLLVIMLEAVYLDLWASRSSPTSQSPSLIPMREQKESRAGHRSPARQESGIPRYYLRCRVALISHRLDRPWWESVSFLISRKG